VFRKEEDRWVINLPNPPASATAYHDDHARLLVRYMFLMTPDEQRRLLATAPAAPTTAGPPAQKAVNNFKRKGGETALHKLRRSKRNPLAWNGSVRANARARGM